MFDIWLNWSDDSWQLPLLYVLVELIGVVSAIEAIYKTRTSEGAIAWSVALISMPLLAVPLYWVFGRRKFRGYVKMRKQNRTWVQLQSARLLEDLQPYTETSQTDVLEKIVQMPYTRGNRVRLLIDGEQTFQAMFEAIRTAEQYVLLEFYIIRDDQVGEQLLELLKKKTTEGVKVCFIYDEIGSLHIGKPYLNKMRRSGVLIHPFNSTKGWSNRFQLNFRNHRKMLVIDGQRAFVGGMNIGDEYIGRVSGMAPWRDTHIELEGPAVSCVQMVFLEDWYWATESMIDLNWQPKGVTGFDQQVLLMATGPADMLESCELVYLHIIGAAEQRVWIVSPYFVPDSATIYALELAALRGVDVRILLPERADNFLVHLSSFVYLREAEQTGIRFYRYAKGFLHQKVFLVDDQLASVGSANLDNRSFRLNFEANILVRDPVFIAQMEAMLIQDFADSIEVNYDQVMARPRRFHLMVRLAHLLAPIQ